MAVSPTPQSLSERTFRFLGTLLYYILVGTYKVGIPPKYQNVRAGMLFLLLDLVGWAFRKPGRVAPYTRVECPGGWLYGIQPIPNNALKRFQPFATANSTRPTAPSSASRPTSSASSASRPGRIHTVFGYVLHTTPLCPLAPLSFLPGWVLGFLSPPPPIWETCKHAVDVL